MDRSGAEVARLFGVRLEEGNAGGEVYPGNPGWVLTADRLQTMSWGFPLALKGKAGQPLKPKPVNNTRSDKLSSAFWRSSFAARRCLVPMTAYCEAEGERGYKTRTWLSAPDQPVFTCAGLWRDSEEWGPVYSVVISECSDQVREVHDRMPVIIPPLMRNLWLSGEAVEAFEMCAPYRELLTIERTDQPWVVRRQAG
jgi:putative SOS response-associated peptidase YedK